MNISRLSLSALLGIATLLCSLSCSGPKTGLVSEFEGGAMYKDRGVNVVCLYGSWKQMGRQWGALERESLHKTYNFIRSKTQSDSLGVKRYQTTAALVFSHYPDCLKQFMEAAVSTSGLTLDQLVELNALEWGEASFQCSGIACWGDYTGGPLVYGRNYDAVSYGELGSEVTVTVFHPEGGGQSFATVGYAGELYCVNGFNESGFFVELNNGLASSGPNINFDISLNTTELMRLIEDAHTMDDADTFFSTTPGAAGFLIGITDGKSARCYEWFGEEAHRSDNNTPDGLVLLTNHFTSSDWNFPDPAEEFCWQSHRRYANLLEFARVNKGRIDVRLICDILRRPVADGGAALTGYDMYQIVFVPSEKMFMLNVPGAGIPWAEIDLGKYLNRP